MPNSGTAEEGEEDEGVTLCHIPPGNPANAHTLTVGAPAVKAHLRHGDTLGACGGSTEPDAGTTPTEPDAGTTPTEPDAGTPPPTGTDAGTTTPDAGTTDPGQTCRGVNEMCGNGIVCCAGLVCRSGFCAPDIN